MSGVFDATTNTWRPYPEADWQLTNLHPETADCARGCVIHAPTRWAGTDWPYSFRADGRVERVCPHGVGHADPDQVRFLIEVRGWSELSAGTHGCDGCCFSVAR